MSVVCDRLNTHWRLVTIDDIRSAAPFAVAIGPFGSRMKSDLYVEKGIPVIRGTNLSDTRALSGDFVYVSQKTADELRSSNVFAGDLVFPHRGAIGAVGIVPANSDHRRWMLSTSLMKLTCDADVAEPLFVYYYFRSAAGKSRLLAHSSSVGTPGIAQPLTSLRSIELPLPPLGAQRKIAATLSAYDDLIESTNRRVKILEEIVGRIYHEWFGDFRYPGHDEEKLVSTELGPLPGGWRWRELRELAAEVRDGADPKSVLSETPYVGLEHMPRHSVALAEWGVARDAESRKFKFELGDVLFGKIRPYFHKVVVPPVSGLCSTDAIVIRSVAPEYAGLVLAVVSSDAFVQRAVQTSQGTKMPRANWAVLERYLVPVPPSDLLARFNAIVTDTVGLLHRYVFSNRVLARTRDLLLPRLIAGEVDVTDLDIAMPPAAAW